MSERESLLASRRLTHQPETRIALKRSGNTGDPHIYVWLGSACLGAIWVESEPMEIGGYTASRTIWRTTIGTEVWPTSEQALKVVLRDFWKQEGVQKSAADALRSPL